jgi:hypothetical protein
MRITRSIGTRDEAHLSGWEIIVSDSGSELHVLFRPPASDPRPDWIRTAYAEHPLGPESGVPAHVLRHGMTLLRSAEGEERAAQAGAPPKEPTKLKKSTSPYRLEREINEALGYPLPRSPRR